MIKHRRSAWQKVQDLILVGTTVFACIPWAFTQNMRFGSIPVLDGFFLMAILAVAVNYALHCRGGRLPVAAYLFGGLFIAGITMLYWDGPAFDSRAALQDVLAYVALPTGIALARVAGPVGFGELLRRCYMATCITFAISLILLLAGYIESTGGVDRELDRAMYTSCFIIPMLFPYIWSTAGSIRKLWKAVALSGMAMSFLFAFVSATRSVLITLVIACACTAAVEVKGNIRKMIWLAAGIMLFLAACIYGTMPGLAAFEQTKLAERLTSSSIDSDYRYDELTMMLDQMGPSEWLHGSGFGVGYPSPTGNGELVTVPHVGILAMLYKSGVPGLVLLILAPCLAGIWRLFLFRRSSADPYLAGIAVYFVQSCFSGGWAFLPLLMLGAFFTMGLLQPRARQSGANILVLTRVPAAVSQAG